jgi:hypothetical protein
MGLGKFPHPQLDMGIPAVLYCYHGDGSGESIADGIYPMPSWDMDLFLSFMGERSYGTGAGGHDYEHEIAYG